MLWAGRSILCNTGLTETIVGDGPARRHGPRGSILQYESFTAAGALFLKVAVDGHVELLEDGAHLIKGVVNRISKAKQ